VAVSAFVVAAALVAMALWFFATTEQRIATYAVQGAVRAVVLDLGGADARVLGADDDSPVRVRRRESFAFGREPDVRRTTTAGVLQLVVRCPELLVGGCSSSYEVTVPANVRVTVRTTAGDVAFNGYRGSAEIVTSEGDIAVGAYCGFNLRARSGTGDVRATASCAPERLELRSQDGEVRATVPGGRYRVDADSDAGSSRVDGLTVADDAPFAIQALSGSGDVRVEAGA